jgi:hypothetical protein
MHFLRCKHWSYVRLALLACAAGLLTGCGSDLGQVSGQVTLDGQPLCGGGDVRATVYFQPASGNGTTATGLVNESGEYKLSTGSVKGVTPGEYVVTISATQLVKSPTGGAAGGKRITDPSYANAGTSGFKFKVEPGSNEYNLALNSRPASGASGRTP